MKIIDILFFSKFQIAIIKIDTRKNRLTNTIIDEFVNETEWINRNPTSMDLFNTNFGDIYII